MTRAEQKARRAAIAKAVADGESMQTCAKRFGVSLATVQIALEEAGEPRHSSHQVPPFRTFAILAALQAGQGRRQIARQFGVSYQRVVNIYSRAKAAGMKFPPSRRRNQVEGRVDPAAEGTR